MLFLSILVATACQPVAPGNGGESGGEESANTGFSTQELIPVKLGVGYIPNVQFAVFYVGIEKGFYTEEKIDLSLDYGFENDYLKLVGTDELQFMVGSSDQVVIGRAQGLPVRYVLNWYTRYPVVIFAKKEANITQPADLKGKTIGIPGPFGASYVALRGILEAAQLQESDIKMESIGFTQVAAVSEGKVDAAVDYAVNGPVVLAIAGTETTQIQLDDYLRIPANGLVTNETTLNENPELVRKMVRATQKAIQYTLDHPDEAFQLSLQAIPEAGGDNEKANRAVFDAVLAYWTPLTGISAGSTTAAEWQAAADLVQKIGLIETATPVDEMFTNEFVE